MCNIHSPKYRAFFRSIIKLKPNRLYYKYIYAVSNKNNKLSLLAAIYIVCALEIERVAVYFKFLKYFLGKAFFCLFMSLLAWDRHKWYSWTVSILFWIACIIFVILGVVFWENEKSGEPGKVPEVVAGGIVKEVKVVENK